MTIYNIKPDVQIPLNEFKSTVYDSTKCGISYRIINLDVANNSLILQLTVVDLATKNIVDILGERVYNSQSTPSFADVAAKINSGQLDEQGITWGKTLTINNTEVTIGDLITDLYVEPEVVEEPVEEPVVEG